MVRFHTQTLANGSNVCERSANPKPGFGQRVIFSPRMWHHAGRPTTGHCTETIGINVTSPQETDNCTLILDKQKFKASISSKNELDYPSY